MNYPTPQPLTAAITLALGLTLNLAQAADSAEQADKSLSPYFFVNSADPATDRLPLKSTDVKVSIAGVIADVVVTQHYHNEGTRPLEARYVFPASSHAAVYAMQMHIGDRVLEAKIREKQQARVEYEAAKSEGKSASLLEQQRPNVFEMNVANVLPGDDIAVELHYTETMIPTEGKYQFVYPTVVGPRYNGAVETGSGVNEAWVQAPYLHADTQATASFALDVDLVSPIPLQQLASTSHNLTIQQPDSKHAHLHLPASPDNANRDFILDYRLAGDSIQTGTLLYKGQDENFFMTMVEPPKRVKSAEIVPREYIFILDISGSMHGFPIDTAKTLLRNLVGQLRPSDTFNVMLFSGSNSVLAPNSMPATQVNINKAIEVIDQQAGSGSTELLPALQQALAMKKTDNRARNFVVITDGYVTVEKQAFDLIRSNLDKANVFAFGIGSSVNRLLMEGIAHAGAGEAFIVTNESEAASAADTFKRYIESPVWTHLAMTIKGLDAYDVQPATLPDLFAERPLVIIGKWRGQPQGQLTVSGYNSAGYSQQILTIEDTLVSKEAAALRYLWARERIAGLADYTNLLDGSNDAEIRQITDLGLQYNLLTDYTSFVAVDHVVRTSETGQTVDQPSPLPQGVSELALGNTVPSTPEPEFYAMLAVAGAISTWLKARNRNHGR